MKAIGSRDERHDVCALVLGGGRGTRLYPLTRYRSKPAVPLAGKYRLVDVAISNCINSGIRKIYVLTQFNSASLNRHVATTYNFDIFSEGFVEILAAEQTHETEMWYQGTADAVRKNMRHISAARTPHVLVLAGDALYRQDYRELLSQHVRSGAEITCACKMVGEEQASGFGIMGIDESCRVLSFNEKPPRENLPPLKANPEILRKAGFSNNESKPYLASMGIYLFRKEVLLGILEEQTVADFGKQVIPRAIPKHQVYASFFDGYWEDIGTIRSFFQANLMLLDEHPEFSFYDTDFPIFTHSRLLPSSQIVDSHLDRAMVSEGCLVRNAWIKRCVIGIRSVIQEGSRLENVVMMGADYYDEQCAQGNRTDRMPVGIGRNCRIENAIIDKNACIGDNVRILNSTSRRDDDNESFCIRDGIVIVQKNAVIPPNTEI